MLVRVMHNNGNYDYVKPQLLDRLIDEKKITSFYRQSGVVVLGVDPVRAAKNLPYDGIERRIIS